MSKEFDENKNDEKDYKVGYKRPPAEHQFKPGQSGNPKGRKKLVKDFKTDFQDELEEKITIQECGKRKLITRQRALIKRLFAGALSGNTSFIKIIIAILSKMPVKIEDVEQDLSVSDAMILQDYIERRTNHDIKQ